MNSETPKTPNSYETIEAELKTKLNVLIADDSIENSANLIAGSALLENSPVSLEEIKEIQRLMEQALKLLGSEKSERSDALQREFTGVCIFLDGVRFGKKSVIKKLQSELETESKK